MELSPSLRQLLNQKKTYVKAAPNANPGEAFGITQEQMQTLGQNQMRRKGFTISLSAGVLSNTPIQLIGQVKILLGVLVSFDDPTQNAGITLTVDNDAVLNNVSYSYLTRDAARSNYTKEYIPIEKLISGSSSISLDINPTGATTARVTFIFI